MAGGNNGISCFSGFLPWFHSRILSNLVGIPKPVSSIQNRVPRYEIRTIIQCVVTEIFQNSLDFCINFSIIPN